VKPIVIIPHVSWRRLALLQLLEQLVKQTKQVRVIVLHDDQDEAAGEHENVRLDQTTQRFLHRPVWWPAELLGGVTPTTPERAQCERWRIIEEAAQHDRSRAGDGVRVLTLDDDMIIDEGYVEHTLTMLGIFGAYTTDPVLSWGGVDYDYHWRHYNESHSACELVLPQAGAMAFYADTFLGLGETPLAQTSHIRNGSEEIPVAAWLWHRGIPIWRPDGKGPQPHKLAYDPRSSFRTTQDTLHRLLEQCIADELWSHAKAIKQLLIGKRPVAWVQR
jgi:hypothetical protein